MTYKESITSAMDELAKDPDVVFVGYGLTHGAAMGTLKNVPKDRLIETPVAENLMVGAAIGLSLRGRKPVVFIERADFLLNALDAIQNHLLKIRTMSRGQFSPACIVRVIVGNKTKPLFTGETHVQDFAPALRQMFHPEYAEVVILEHAHHASDTFRNARARMGFGNSTFVTEYKDLY